MSQEAPFEYWLHMPSGFVWAVQVVNGEILCAAGPLLVGEADPDILPYLDYSVRDGVWVREHLTEFVGHETRAS